VLHGDVSRRNCEETVALQAQSEVAESQLVEGLRRVDQDVSMVGEPTKDVDLMEQGSVGNYDGLRGNDRFAESDRLVIDPAKRNDGCAGAFGTKTWEGLCVCTFIEGCH
jgi:hypothetical protein